MRTSKGMKALALAAVSCAELVLAQSATSTASGALPTVDLGYAVHQASSFNETGQYYQFNNIRYAAPPVGPLRFSAPIPPQGVNRTVNDGSYGFTCPQAEPAWLELTELRLEGASLTQLEAAQALINKTFSNPSSFPGNTPSAIESEDCLFLDVYSPVSIYESDYAKANRIFPLAGHEPKGFTGAPVLVWIYGGGYTAGAKDASSYLPPGLLNAAKQEDSKGEGFVYIALNYRLGLFGWLAGPTFQIDGNANNGLYDQRLALEWVQKYAPLFGGDPNRVTVMGESAGGGSILHQITAYGGLRGPVPFQQAIPQSPAFQALPSPLQQEDTFQKTLGYASAISNTTVTTLAQLRALPSSVLYAVNAYSVSLSNYGTFTYGPAVDGKFVPALPGTLLLHNQFDSSVKVMVGHNLNESFIFTSPFVANNTQLEEVFSELVPSLTPSIASYIENVLYPPVFDGSYGYYDDDIRASLVIAESTFTCNTRYLDLAFKNQTYSYMFAVPPGYHGNDVTYTFYNGPPSLNPVAATFQSYLTSFAVTGTPNAPGGATRPYFPMYGKNSTIMDIQDVDGTQVDTVANSRCDWWQKGLYY